MLRAFVYSADTLKNNLYIFKENSGEKERERGEKRKKECGSARKRERKTEVEKVYFRGMFGLL